MDTDRPSVTDVNGRKRCGHGPAGALRMGKGAGVMDANRRTFEPRSLSGLRSYIRPRGQEPKGKEGDPEAVKTAKARAKARAEGREAAGGSRRRREPKGNKDRRLTGSMMY